MISTRSEKVKARTEFDKLRAVRPDAASDPMRASRRVVLFLYKTLSPGFRASLSKTCPLLELRALSLSLSGSDK